MYSASGCPIANRNKLRALELESAVEKHKPFVTTLPSQLKLDPVSCPTSGSDANDHNSGSYLTHRSLAACPTSQGFKRPRYDENTPNVPVRSSLGESPIHMQLFI